MPEIDPEQDAPDEHAAHKHFICTSCAHVHHDAKGTMADGDACEECIVGKVQEAHPLPDPRDVFSDVVGQQAEAFGGLMRRMEGGRVKHANRMHRESLEVSNRTARALESIAVSLEELMKMAARWMDQHNVA